MKLGKNALVKVEGFSPLEIPDIVIDGVHVKNVYPRDSYHFTQGISTEPASLIDSVPRDSLSEHASESETKEVLEKHVSALSQMFQCFFAPNTSFEFYASIVPTSAKDVYLDNLVNELGKVPQKFKRDSNGNLAECISDYLRSVVDIKLYGLLNPCYINNNTIQVGYGGRFENDGSTFLIGIAKKEHRGGDTLRRKGLELIVIEKQRITENIMPKYIQGAFENNKGIIYDSNGRKCVIAKDGITVYFSQNKHFLKTENANERLRQFLERKPVGDYFDYLFRMQNVPMKFSDLQKLMNSFDDGNSTSEFTIGRYSQVAAPRGKYRFHLEAVPTMRLRAGDDKSTGLLVAYAIPVAELTVSRAKK